MALSKHHIVALDNWVLPPTTLSFEHTSEVHDVVDPSTLPSITPKATILMTSFARVTRAGIEAAPHLQLVACNGTGSNQVDKEACRERGITVAHVPAQNTDSVAEHAFALYYALRRQIVPMHQLTVGGEAWAKETIFRRFAAPPRTNAEEIVVVIGYGVIGKSILGNSRKIESISRALGMQVLIAERRGLRNVRDGRVAFQEAIRRGTVFMLAAPLDDTTRGIIGVDEFAVMNSSALVINVARGGIVDERALVYALKDGLIGGAACDSFETEPATRGNSVLLDPSIPNLVLSPHIAWYSSKTIKGTDETVKANLEAFVAGQPINVVS